MKEGNYTWYHRNIKDYKRILWIAVWQQIGQPRRNEQILRISNLPRLNHKETENFNRLISSEVVETVNKNSPQNRSPGPDGFTMWILPIIQRFNTYLSISSNKLKKKKYFLLILLGQHYPDIKTRQGHHKKIIGSSLMNTDAKILNKILANHTLKGSYTMIKWNLP